MVAVSGGVDSMVLLDILAKQAKSSKLKAQSPKKSFQLPARDLQLVVAHFDHGIRRDSDKDVEFVHQAAKRYKLPLEVGYGKLGPNASEERAREVRYKFLTKVKDKHQAKAIITAHHQDDLIETAIINLMRGTGRRGLTAIAQNTKIIRPLLHLSKKDIGLYAKQNRLNWREDLTNKDERYLRNFVRAKIVTKLSDKQRQQLLKEIHKLGVNNQLLDQEIAKLSQKLVKGITIDRNGFTALPTEVAQEILMNFLRNHNILGFDKKTIERLAVAIKTARAGTKHDVVKGALISLTSSEAVLSTTD